MALTCASEAAWGAGPRSQTSTPIQAYLEAVWPKAGALGSGGDDDDDDDDVRTVPTTAERDR